MHNIDWLMVLTNCMGSRSPDRMTTSFTNRFYGCGPATGQY